MTIKTHFASPVYEYSFTQDLHKGYKDKGPAWRNENKNNRTVEQRLLKSNCNET